MKTCTIAEAKDKLDGLVQAAEHGEQVLILRGSKPAAVLVPVQDDELVYWPKLTVSDRAAEALLKEAKQEYSTGKARVFNSAAALRKAFSKKTGPAR